MNSKGLKSTSGNLRALPSVTLLVYHCSYLPPMFWNSGVVHQWFFSLSKGVKPSQVLAFLTTQLCKWITHRSLQLPLLPSYFQSRWRKKTPTQLDEYTVIRSKIIQSAALSGNRKGSVSSKHSPQVRTASQAHQAHFPHKSSQVWSQSRDSSQSEHQSHPPVNHSMANG